MKHFLFLTCLFFTCNFSFSQLNKNIKVTLDCANEKNYIKVADAGKCTELVIKGEGSENYSVVSAVLSLTTRSNMLKEFEFTGNKLFPEAMENIKKLKSGDMFMFENIKILDSETNKTYSLPTLKLTIK